MLRKLFDWPPIWMGLALVLIYLIAKLLPIFILSHYLPSIIWVAPFVIGLIYILWAEVEFLRAKTSVIPRRKPSKLITSGPFKVSRNPIYTGYALIILAIILKFGNIFGFGVLAIFVWVINKRFIEGEEKNIIEIFGEEARYWFENTKRW